MQGHSPVLTPREANAILAPTAVGDIRWNWSYVTPSGTRLPTVKGMLNMAMTFVASYVGWVIGAKISFFTAFVVSTIFTGVGLWLSIKITRYYLP